MVNKKLLLDIDANIQKAIDDISYKRANKYLKPIRNKIWRSLAVKYMVLFGDEMYRALSAYKTETLNILSSKAEIFNAEVEVEKARRRYRTDEYLDKWYNHVVVDDIRDELVELKKRFTRQMEKTYERYINQGLNKETASMVFRDIGIEFNFNKFDKATSRYLSEKKINWARQVSNTNERAVKKSLKKGFEAGDDFDAIATRIEKATGFSYRRSEAIARTEIMIASNYIDYTAYMQNDRVVSLTWSATMDEPDRTRDSHKKVNGVTVEKGTPFIVNQKHEMRFPGDSSLGAPAEEIINCRCVLLANFAERRYNNEVANETVNNSSNTVSNDALNTVSNETRFIEKLERQEGMTASYRQALIERFNNGTELAQMVFLKYVQDNSVADTSFAGTAHYDPRTGFINMNFEEDLDNLRGAGVTYFHEHGHLIDFVNDRLSVRADFDKVLEMDYEDFIRRFMLKAGISNREDAYDQIGEELLREDIVHLFSAVSDLLEGLSESQIEGGYGHEEKYWIHPHSISVEAFAHFFEAQFDRERLNALKEVFPLAIELFDEYLEDLNE